jgi:hypothetical protein
MRKKLIFYGLKKGNNEKIHNSPNELEESLDEIFKKHNLNSFFDTIEEKLKTVINELGYKLQVYER